VKRLIPSTREIEWDIGRNVPRPANSGIGGVKGHNAEENTLPGSAACGREASNDWGYQRYNPTLAKSSNISKNNLQFRPF
jgi:hypothetical protein